MPAWVDLGVVNRVAVSALLCPEPRTGPVDVLIVPGTEDAWVRSLAAYPEMGESVRPLVVDLGDPAPETGPRTAVLSHLSTRQVRNAIEMAAAIPDHGVVGLVVGPSFVPARELHEAIARRGSGIEQFVFLCRDEKTLEELVARWPGEPSSHAGAEPAFIGEAMESFGEEPAAAESFGEEPAAAESFGEEPAAAESFAEEPAAVGSAATESAGEVPEPADPVAYFDETAVLASSARVPLRLAFNTARVLAESPGALLYACLRVGVADLVRAVLLRLAPHGDTEALLARLADVTGMSGTHAGATESVADAARWARPAVERTATVVAHLGRRSGAEIEHLLAGVLLDELSPAVAAAVGTDAYGMRVALRDALAEVRPGEDLVAWDEALGLVELAGGISRELVDPTVGLGLEADHLGVRNYVTMLATVVSRRDTPLPLSIGLFGEWGSGKSTFMALLRGQVERLAASDSPAYHRDVVQIGFNAWHYADTNLWASLGNTIFDRLAGPKETVEHRRAEVKKELAEKNRRRQELDAATTGARDEAVRLRAEIDGARQSTKDLLAAIATADAVRERLGGVWKKLGVSDPVRQGELLADQVRGAREDVAGWRQASVGRRAVAAAAIAVALLLLAAAAVAGGPVGRWLAGGGLTTVAALAGVVAVGIGRARAGLRELTTIAAEIRTGTAERAAEAVAPRLERLRRAEAQELVLGAQLDEVVQRVGELGRELAELSPGQRLYSFVSERAASQDYRGQLGLVSTVRHDLQQLAELMQRWRREGGDAPRPIDRIVLYIDDLDRCSPRQVVDVLQAVHLLLALDLFVVVLGVDPRVLHRSLEREMSGTFGEATPRDYLEKIFNIPFVLPTMDPAGFAALIRGLSTEDPEDADDTEDAVEPVEGARPVATGSGAHQSPARQFTGDDGKEYAALVPEQGSEVEAIQSGQPRRAVPRALTDAERDMLASVARLVRSPRQAKRLLNLYRMVRSTRDLGPASRFLGADDRPGDHQAVVVLLGLLTAYPDRLGRLVDHLATRPTIDTWAQVAADLARTDGWETVVERLRPATELVMLPDLTAFQAWGPHVTRFSFLLSPLATAPVGTP